MHVRMIQCSGVKIFVDNGAAREMEVTIKAIIRM